MGSSIISVGVPTRGRALGRQRDNWGMYRGRKRTTTKGKKRKQTGKWQPLQPELGKKRIHAMVNLAMETAVTANIREKAKQLAADPKHRAELFAIGLAVAEFYHSTTEHSFKAIKDRFDQRGIVYQRTAILYLCKRNVIPPLSEPEQRILRARRETLAHSVDKMPETALNLLGASASQKKLTKSTKPASTKRKRKQKKRRASRIATPARPIQSVKVPVPPNRWLNHRITVQFVTAKANEKPEVYQVVPKEEANIALGKISVVAPLIRGLGNHRVGEEFQVAAPQGNLTYRLLAVS